MWYVEGMSRVAPRITLLDADRIKLQKWSQSRKTAQRLVLRSSIILKAAAGERNNDIAVALRTSRPTVQLWRDRFLSLGIRGLEKDATRPGRKKSLDDGKVREVVELTLHHKPRAETHWSQRLMAERAGLSKSAIQRIWSTHNLKPHLVRTFKLSNDKHFIEKLNDVVGLYLNPPDNSLVLSFDEKTQIQALDRTQPLLPLRPGLPETRTHDYKRHGTTTLFAALDILKGFVISKCVKRHRHQEFIRFLNQIDRETPRDVQLHIIADNYATHKHENVKKWFSKHKRFHIHFIPTSSSWLNLVERWFGEITRRRIRRGTFNSVPDLIRAIEEYVAVHNENPKPFVWTASVQSILDKIAKVKKR